MSKSIIEYSPQDIKIAELSAEWYGIIDIVKTTAIQESVVFDTLERPDIQQYVETYIKKQDLWLQTKRIKAWHALLPKVIKLVNRILDQQDQADKATAKIAEFKYVEMMLKELNKAEVKALQFNQQINISPEKATIDKGSSNELDDILSQLPTKEMAMYWEQSLALARNLLTTYKNAKNTNKVQDVQVVSWTQGWPWSDWQGDNIFA